MAAAKIISTAAICLGGLYENEDVNIKNLYSQDVVAFGFKSAFRFRERRSLLQRKFADR